MATLKALLVDLDDTLLDYSGPAPGCWESACRAVAAPAGIDHAALLAAIHDTARWFWSDPARHRAERVDMPGAWRKIAAGALERLGVQPDGLARAIAEDFAARRRQAMRLFPDAEPALVELKRAGVALALVTNGDAREQRDKIERHRLAPHFDAIVIEGELGCGKPDPRVYRAALDGLGVEPADAWMVGDHLEFDMAGPRRLGLSAAWLDRVGAGLPVTSPAQPTRIVRSLTELVSGFR